MLSITIKYILFATIATLANLGIQRIVLSFGNTFDLIFAAIFSGTLAGLLLKFWLDKRWVFTERSRSDREGDSRLEFVLYTLTGVITTLLFWGTELVFWWVWQTDRMRELGAVIGLGVGYLLKYQLDKRFVFTPLVERKI